MRALIVLAAALLLAGPALAAAPKKDEAEREKYMNVSSFAAPVFSRGRVVNYVFVDLRLHVKPETDLDAFKHKEPHLRAALVRAAHRSPLNAPDDLSSLDEAKLTAAALVEARRIPGGAAVTRAEVRKLTPQRRLSSPGKAQP